MRRRKLLALYLTLLSLLGGNNLNSCALAEETKKKLPNVLWILLDDISTERFPESGNTVLEGLLPGWERLKSDPNTVYYEHFYSPSSLCAPSQVALFSGLEPADIGGQYQQSSFMSQDKAPYRTVPPPDVQFLPELLRGLGYYSTAGGKLDYQVADVIPTFYHAILGGAYSDVTSYQEDIWDPAIKLGRPFFGMLNMMDMHQLISTFSREAPVPISNPDGGGPPSLPFGPFGYGWPMSLIFQALDPNGQPGPRRVAQTNVEEVDIVGYAGAFNESVLNHSNGGVPGYLPDEIGIKSILAREYDLIRNTDYRLLKIIESLEAKGLYNDTMIMVFGDHGSGTYKAKSLLEPQSLRTPCWIKYPAGTKLPSAVQTRSSNGTGDNYNVDDRMTGILDLFPTTLSVLGIEPPPWIKAGVPLAGEYTVEHTRDVMFAIVQRLQAITGWKSFAAFTKKFHYQRNVVTYKSIANYTETVMTVEEQLAAALGSVESDNMYQTRFNLFAASPIFDRVRRLLKVNANDQEFLDSYCGIAADDATTPSEVLYDLEADPYGTRNLIMNSSYKITVSDELQPWGNNVSEIRVEYGPIDDSSLLPSQTDSLTLLRASLNEWIESQKWVTPEFVFGEGGFAEENAMARVFWPNGVEPLTSPVDVTAVGDSQGEGAKLTFAGSTPGTVIRYSVVSPEHREQCEQLPSNSKDEIPVMTIFNSGLKLSEYVSLWNDQNYTGYYYNRSIVLTTGFGETPGCDLFVSSHGTFVELTCINDVVFAWDTRDSTWNGTDWVGLTSSGEWDNQTGPVTVFDNDSLTWNPAAFHAYIFGPLREEIYSGFNADGSKFHPMNLGQTPLNTGVDPPPKYWLMPDRAVNVVPPRLFTFQPFAPSGWSLDSDRSYYHSTNSKEELDDKGSFSLAVFYRGTGLAFFSSVDFSFRSFNYGCLLWDVGNHTTLSFTDSDKFHIFAQGVRKGYANSPIVEKLLLKTELFNSSNTDSGRPEENTSAGHALLLNNCNYGWFLIPFVVLVVGV